MFYCSVVSGLIQEFSRWIGICWLQWSGSESVAGTARGSVHAAVSTGASFSNLRGMCSVYLILMLGEPEKRKTCKSTFCLT